MGDRQSRKVTFQADSHAQGHQQAADLLSKYDCHLILMY